MLKIIIVDATKPYFLGWKAALECRSTPRVEPIKQRVSDPGVGLLQEWAVPADRWVAAAPDPWVACGARRPA